MRATRQNRSCGQLTLWVAGLLSSFLFAVGVMPAVSNADDDDLIVVGVMPPDFLPNDNKIRVCHRPPGNPDHRKTIKIGRSAVPAHLDHGDFVGECPDDEDDVWGGSGSGAMISEIPFTFVFCDGRKNEEGRSLRVNVTGRRMVDKHQCE